MKVRASDSRSSHIQLLKKFLVPPSSFFTPGLDPKSVLSRDTVSWTLPWTLDLMSIIGGGRCRGRGHGPVHRVKGKKEVGNYKSR
jgi:hypothetical protein